MASLHWQIEPMPRWPYPETKPRKPNPFRAKFDATLALLKDELDHLEVRSAVAVRVVTDEADLRQDGMLRARARVLHSGVALSFHSAKAGSLTVTARCGTATTPPANWRSRTAVVAVADRTCQMELCPNWSGDGNVCPCAVFDLPQPAAGRGGDHQPDCQPGEDCIECGGCECGAEPSTCTGPPCYSRDAYEQDADEAGWERSYG